MNMKNLIPNLLNRFIGNPALSSIVSLGVLVLISLPASAATFTVNSLDDNGVGDCDGITCTLRDALSESVTDGEPSVIDFAPGLSGVITLQLGELHVVGSDLDIQGPGPELITVSANNASRVFHFNSSTSTISYIHICTCNMNCSGMNSPGAAAASCNMNGSGMNKLIMTMAPP